MTPIPTFVTQLFGPLAALQLCGCPFFVRTWAKCWMASKRLYYGWVCLLQGEETSFVLSLDELIQWHSIGHEVIGHIEEGKESIKGRVWSNTTQKVDLLYLVMAENVHSAQFLGHMGRGAVQRANGVHAYRVYYFMWTDFSQNYIMRVQTEIQHRH